MVLYLESLSLERQTNFAYQSTVGVFDMQKCYDSCIFMMTAQVTVCSKHHVFPIEVKRIKAISDTIEQLVQLKSIWYFSDNKMTGWERSRLKITV